MNEQTYVCAYEKTNEQTDEQKSENYISLDILHMSGVLKKCLSWSYAPLIWIWLVGLEFNNIKVMSSQLVCLTTLFLGILGPLSSLQVLVVVHILLPETDNCTS